MANNSFADYMEFPIGPMTTAVTFDPDSLGYVYIIGLEGDGVVKIGSTLCVPSRLSELQVGCPFELHLKAAVSVYEGNRYHVEFAAHQLARSAWVRGEWFNLNAKVALRLVLKAARNKKARFGSAATAYHKYHQDEADRVAAEPARRAQEEVDRLRVLRTKLGIEA